eukprot:sb/3474193/
MDYNWGVRGDKEKELQFMTCVDIAPPVPLTVPHHHFPPSTLYSATDLTRKHGEESPVYHRPLPRYPVNRRPTWAYMLDGPKWAPKTDVDKFRKLNVLFLDKPARERVLKLKRRGQRWDDMVLCWVKVLQRRTDKQVTPFRI